MEDRRSHDEDAADSSCTSESVPTKRAADPDSDTTRRHVLIAVGGTTVALAGCLEDDPEDPDDEEAAVFEVGFPAQYDGDATEVVTHDGTEYLDDEQIEDGWVLPCVAYPKADFDLEVAHPDDE